MRNFRRGRTGSVRWAVMISAEVGRSNGGRPVSKEPTHRCRRLVKFAVFDGYAWRQDLIVSVVPKLTSQTTRGFDGSGWLL
jgi:hypothetical protein